MERTIRVTGKGKISVKPDTIRLIITQKGIEKQYEKAVRASAERKSDLNAALAGLGFGKADLKTLYFNVDTEYESYQTKAQSWRRRLVGYRFTHRMKLEFPVDNEMLGKVLMVVSRCSGEPEFTIQYTISDPEAAKNELLARAVADSMAKAKVLSQAAGVELKQVLTIDYSWGEVEFTARPMNEMMLTKYCCADGAAPDSIDLDIEADDIDVTDTVTVVWELADKNA